jgi:hypothetical protein
MSKPDGKISIIATIPRIQAAFKYLEGGGARITLDLEPASATKYFQFIQLADRQGCIVTGSLGLELIKNEPPKHADNVVRL